MAPTVHRFYPNDQTEYDLCDLAQTPEAIFGRIRSVHGPPSQLYYGQVSRGGHNSTGLIQTDGACINNGKERPFPGAAFVYGPWTPTDAGSVEIQLGAEYATSNRAELKAVIDALAFRSWWTIFDRLVIATDSELVVRGCTELYDAWEKQGWRTRSARSEPVKNRDLWVELMRRIDFVGKMACEVAFWKIPREWNAKADALAKRAASAAAEAGPYGKRFHVLSLGMSVVASTYTDF
ncbi:hypothetical protein CVT26_011331 [Gymnopilus dilepis]|uniref:ribonuclease H n=1 Tax=Gymnopilus dilepis TaxID=231916 RepID=A0A409X4K1_9AGAR|nr:hypothetical protein CVT26_011331 [Gymnopilus dilepis]